MPRVLLLQGDRHPHNQKIALLAKIRQKVLVAGNLYLSHNHLPHHHLLAHQMQALLIKISRSLYFVL